jgi:hypothetical protein
MRMITIAIAAAGFVAVAGSASAAATDVDYLKANRCRGLAEGVQGAIDTAALDAYLKAEKRTRQSSVIDRGRNEMDKAKREAKTTNEERKARLTKELSGPCQVYKS